MSDYIYHNIRNSLVVLKIKLCDKQQVVFTIKTAFASVTTAHVQKAACVVHAATLISANVKLLYYQHISSDIVEGHLQSASQAGTGQRVDLKRNVQSIDPNSVGLWFLILRPDFSQL